MKKVLSQLLLLIFVIAFIAPGEGKCQGKSGQKTNRIQFVKKDPQSGMYLVQPMQETQTIEKKSVKQRFDQRKFEKELNTLKKISDRHTMRKRMYQAQQKAEKERTIRKTSEIKELERIKLFGKLTLFYKSPVAPKPARNSFLSKTLVSNVLINGKTHDTVSVHDPFSLTFTSAPNYVSASVNVYIDADNNGIASSGDLQIVNNGLIMDNSEGDEDPVEGLFKLTFSKESGYSDIVSSLIFEVNDYQSVSSAVVTVEQKPSNAVIMGTITPPLQNILINASFNSSEGVFILSDSLGKFKINVDRERTKQVMLQTLDLTGISNGYIFPKSQVITITSDTTEVNITSTPATTFIEGYVKDQNGAAIKNVTVQAYNSSLGSITTQSDSLGYYKLGVMAGTWHLYAEITGSADYLQNNYSYSVSVLNNSTLQHDFVLVKANSVISGKIILNTTGVGGIPIRTNADTLYNYVISSTNGNYEMPVYKPASGTISYSVNTSVPEGYYVLTPAKIGIQPGATNVNFEIKKVTGGIQGTITDSRTGKPVPNARIYASGTDYRNIFSNDSGYYRMNLMDGVYSLQVSSNLYYPYGMNNIIVAGGMTTKNFALNRSGSFSGIVKDEYGKAVYDANITAIDSSGYPTYYNGFSDENGNYTVSQLKTLKYRAFVSANGYISQWYNQTYEKDSAAFFQVIDGYDTPNIDFVLSKGGSISGRVVDKSGNGIAGIEVDVFDTLSNGGSYAVTNDSGYYSAEGLATGMYYVRTYSTEYADQWYNDANTLEKATMVQVVINQNTPDINFILAVGASISGMIKDKSNIGILYAQINILDSSFYPINYAIANGSGYYFVGQLQSAKKYYVAAKSNGYAQRWYNNVSTPDSATAIILQEEEKKENIDFTLSKAGAISGRVLDYAGKPIPYFTLTIEDSTGNNIRYGYTDTQGKYTISNLSNGKYYAKTFDYHYEEQWFDHKTSKLDADIINVVEEETTENINFDPHKPEEIPCDSILIKIELANIPDTLTFSQSYVGDYYVDYAWSVMFDADGNDTSGTDGFEIEIALTHFKKPGDVPYKSDIINGTTHIVLEWNGNSGYTRHSYFSVWIDPSNKNILVMSVPKSWSEINKINSNTKYSVNTYFYASNGSYRDITASGYGGANISDPQGDTKYNFIDIISASWQLKPVVSVSNEEVIPVIYSLSQNYPNPFNPTTTVAYGIPVESKVTLTLYNMLGEVILKNDLGIKASGSHQLQMDLRSKASGVYFYEMEANPLDGSKNFRQVKKMILLK
ncbi:MAG: carboxypeptidase regulatory-like domain-containing protein [Ignavibacteriaceae bacterium]|jgi:protocatechuate 3,4-dioxygenase beta subunit|nr:carboxypeptidase regulatory-like domain-containing protein [Ignavibacteriaceae bacterium]